MTDDPRRRKPRHPKLGKRELAAQRGEDPPDAIGPPQSPEFPDEDPEWQPDPNLAGRWRGLIGELGREHRPNREDVLPYLLIRAYAPGDRAVRPTWPPTPCWLSPDIHLIDASWTGPFQADQVVGSPIAGRTYRVFVHVWNLGLLGAYGVHVRAWHVNPGFFGGAPGTVTPQLIGGAIVDLAPRTAPGAHKVVEVIPPWPIPSNLTGHECLLAAAECPADRWSGVLDANNDRHVGQRNISILAGGQSLAPVLSILGEALALGQLLEMTLAVSGGRDAFQFGVPTDGGQHLFVAANVDGALFVLPTMALRELVGELPDLSEPGSAARVFGRAVARSLEGVEPTSLDRALGRLLDTDDLSAERVAQALGGDADAYVLHLSAFDREGLAGGGYSVRIEPKAPPGR